jgi:outer membrane protein TolC
LNIIYSVTEAFYALYRTTRQLEIARGELDQQQQSYDLARQKFEAGLIPEVEALQMEVDLAQSRNDLLAAEGNLSREADRFKMTVGLPLAQGVTVRTDFALSPFEVDEQKAITHGLKHRSEVRETEINRRLAEITLKETDALRTVRIDVSGFYELSGVSDAALPFDTGTGELFRSSLSDLERRPRNRGVFLNVTLPLWDSGVNRSEVAAARAVVSQNELEVRESLRRVERDIRSAVTRLYEARNRLDVLKQSEDVASRSYDISLARFDNGDITSQELALDRDRLTQARTAYLEAYIQYQLAVADLKRQTLYDFENNRSLLETPEEG